MAWWNVDKLEYNQQFNKKTQKFKKKSFGGRFRFYKKRIDKNEFRKRKIRKIFRWNFRNEKTAQYYLCNRYKY